VTDDLGYVDLDRQTLQRAEREREADLASCVVRHASPESAAARARRRAGKTAIVEARVLQFLERARAKGYS
jgi:hypothetical protein